MLVYSVEQKKTTTIYKIKNSISIASETEKRGPVSAFTNDHEVKIINVMPNTQGLRGIKGEKGDDPDSISQNYILSLFE